jgi:hypothetical protein
MKREITLEIDLVDKMLLRCWDLIPEDTKEQLRFMGLNGDKMEVAQ